MLSRQIKTFLKSVNVKNSVRTHHSTITVVFKSPVTKEIVEAVKAMETVKAHGSIYDDTRYYTGISIQFRYEFEPTKKEVEKAEEFFNSWTDCSKANVPSFRYHFRKQLNDNIGPVADKILSKYYPKYY